VRTRVKQKDGTNKRQKERRKKMTTIEIKDLEMEKELNEKAMANVVGGCCPNRNDLPDGTAILGGGGGYMVMANPFDPFTIIGRYPTIPSWLWGRLTPTNNG
jgi:hypothetical protein